MIDHCARAENIAWFAATGESATGAARRLGLSYQGAGMSTHRCDHIHKAATPACPPDCEPTTWHETEAAAVAEETRLALLGVAWVVAWEAS